MASIRYINFIKIRQGNKYYFGGDQSWWENTDDVICQVGCGVIALCNLELYVDGIGRKGIDYDEYVAYVNRRYNEVYHLNKGSKLKKLGLLPLVMEHGLDEFYSKRGIDPVLSWCPTLNKKKIRMLINKMLDSNIPIVASYYVFNKQNKLDLYSYNEKNKSFDKASSVRRHYFNIVGITKRDGKDLLIVSTWGKKYYAYYDQWIKKLSLFSNILYVE